MAVLAFLGYFAFILVGWILRYRHVGRVCSGDLLQDSDVDLEEMAKYEGLEDIKMMEPYLWKSGRFIGIYVVVLGKIPFYLLCGAGCFIGFVWIYEKYFR